MFHDGKMNYKYSMIFFTTTVINATLLSTISSFFHSLQYNNKANRCKYSLVASIITNTYHVTISLMLAELNYRKKELSYMTNTDR
jgi:hypothetical protein